MDKFSFNTLFSNLKVKSGSSDLSKNSDIMELAQIIGVNDVNNEDALYDKLMAFISNYKETIEERIRCFLDDNRYIADSEDNIILLYILYNRYKNGLYKGEISECIKVLDDENKKSLLKVGELLNNLFRTYHKDYYSKILTTRVENFTKSIDEKINRIDKPTISYSHRTEKGKNSFIKGILLALAAFELLVFLFYYWKSHTEIMGLENKIQQLEKENKDLSDQNKQLQQELDNLDEIEELNRKIEEKTKSNNNSSHVIDDITTGIGVISQILQTPIVKPIATIVKPIVKPFVKVIERFAPELLDVF